MNARIQQLRTYARGTRARYRLLRATESGRARFTRRRALRMAHTLAWRAGRTERDAERRENV